MHDVRASRQETGIRSRLPAMRTRRRSADHAAFPRLGLIALAAAIFVSMSTEFLPGGLLPDIAATYDRPVTDVGQLITVFAATVILTATPLAILTRRVPRKPLAVSGLIGIAMATALTALAPTFEVLLVARALGGMAHGLFWAVAAAYAADLVPASRLGRATAITAAGGSLAGVLGVPLGNALGQLLGWRAAFAALAVCAALAVVLVAALLPPVSVKARTAETTATPRTPSTLPGILLVCGIILFVVIGQTTFGTYSVVWLTEVASIPAKTLPLYLLGTGVAAFLAVTAVGHVADRYPRAALLVAVALVAVLMASFPLALAWGLPALIVVALAQSMAFAVAPMLLQARMMRIASPRQRSTAAALQTTAFNISIGGGAVVGAVVVGAWGLDALPALSALLTATGLCVLLASTSSAGTPATVPMPRSTSTPPGVSDVL
jgi:predicted MFS family arabinose efflux permease